MGFLKSFKMEYTVFLHTRYFRAISLMLIWPCIDSLYINDFSQNESLCRLFLLDKVSIGSSITFLKPEGDLWLSLLELFSPQSTSNPSSFLWRSSNNIVGQSSPKTSVLIKFWISYKLNLCVSCLMSIVSIHCPEPRRSWNGGCSTISHSISLNPLRLDSGSHGVS